MSSSCLWLLLSGLVVLTPTKGLVPCPDKEYSCADGQTCCQIKAGGFGCCPMAPAVCCADGIHCCPGGTRCDLQRRACIPRWPSYSMVESAAAPIGTKEDQRGAASIVAGIALEKSTAKMGRHGDDGYLECNDGTLCHDQDTCCQGEDGHMACCPSVNGVCCPDLKHCCPSGYACSNKPGVTCEIPKFGPG